MPRIPDQLLESVFYIYNSEADAIAGERNGGSGFFVGIASEWFDGRSYIYAVTNRHVLRELGPEPVLRLNLQGGAFGCIQVDQDQWCLHPDGDDVAVCHITVLDSPFRYAFIPRRLFVTKERIEEKEIGPGEQVFMIGRFFDHEGRQKNTPAVRFGDIAMMPHEPILQEDSGFEQESFLIEARSIPGYSGSPVFVYIPPLSMRPTVAESMIDWQGPWLLGIDWGHINEELAVLTLNGRKVNELKIRSNAGMAAVVPAWKLAELLDCEAVAAERRTCEDLLKIQAARAASLDKGRGK